MILNTVLHGLELIISRSFESLGLNSESLDCADIYRFGKAGTPAAQYEKETWPFLKEITEKYPEAGIHFRGMSTDHTSRPPLTSIDAIVYSRKKDEGTTRMTTELTSGSPWYKDVVPNVPSPFPIQFRRWKAEPCPSSKTSLQTSWTPRLAMPHSSPPCASTRLCTCLG